MSLQSTKEKYFRKIYIALSLMLLALTIGVTGFMVIEDFTLIEAIYMTIITVSTVGFGEVHQLSEEGRLFTSFIIVSNIGIFAYSVSTISSFILDGEFRTFFKIYKLNKAISKLSNHIVVCGYGRNGKQVCDELGEAGQPFLVIEKDPERLNYIYEHAEILCVEGDATDDEILHSINLNQAKAIITTLPKDADNVFVTLSAKEIHPEIFVISRASEETSETKLKRAGADKVIMPERIGGTYMAALVTKPDTMEFVSLITGEDRINGATLSFEEISFEHLSENYKNKSIKDLDIRNKTGANIIGLKDQSGKYLINPPADFIIKPSTKLIILGNDQQIDKLKNLLTN